MKKIVTFLKKHIKAEILIVVIGFLLAILPNCKQLKTVGDLIKENVKITGIIEVIDNEINKLRGTNR